MKVNESSIKNQNYNRLIHEKSPYLLQHAKNPVDWYPWGDEAFETAKKENKPIFLSIGYSTCHWCHVMAHESFEDPEVARLMNETFINIKVDREERPEIDNFYMAVCQMITGSGGWPLTIIMDADKQPFTAGTYFPKESRFGRIGMLELIPKIKDYWINNREELELASSEIREQLQSTLITHGEGLTEEILEEAFKEATLLFDEIKGGIRGKPKFPTPHKWLFLLRYWYRTGNNVALSMVEKTLQEMRKGGIYDHIGFGFHRYSTDSDWLLPHFEKMLYDQALLIIAYSETYLVTKKDEYRIVVEEIISYVFRNMLSPEGGFYSAEDADSEGEEGKFYTWNQNEIKEILNDEDAKLFLEIFNFKAEGNFVDEATRTKTGKNIPYLTKALVNIAADLKISEKQLHDKLENIRKKVALSREKRIRPHTDDKILTDWNGLMIAALSIAGRHLNNKEYVQVAEKAIDFILTKIQTTDGRLMHRYREGHVAIKGLVDDYAFVIWALLELYESTFNIEYLKKAIQFNDILIKHFWDETHGGFFFTPDDGEQFLIRKKEIYDGAIPSGNSIATLNLLRISRITSDMILEEKVLQIGKAFSSIIEQSLFAHAMFLTSLEYLYGNSFEVVIVGKENSKDFLEMISSLRNHFIPNKVVLFLPINEANPGIFDITDFVKFKSSIDEKATAHVCINKFCKFPTNDITKMLELLNINKK
ncbi:MAG: thioredoxin domain-containing protein [Candidatus Heimdallarchaeota archaeon]|nr:thioredoxin domain-containing protein [Candidatus Heimdallarchaeota archaeon]